MSLHPDVLHRLKNECQRVALEQGFQQLRVTDTGLDDYYPKYQQWLAEKMHGDMGYLERNTPLRQHPQELKAGTLRVLTLRYDYLPADARFTRPLADSRKANISRYALGRDYHKLLRKKLKAVAEAIKQQCEQLDYRVFVDSAPVMETALAEKSGLGWKGKHSLIINEKAGSWFFLGEIFINLALPLDKPVKNQCGPCTSCLNLCPTEAIIAPYVVDARKCISYLTIENQGAIPLELRSKIGNRVYGCDDCQLACPWNRFAQLNQFEEFVPRNQFDDRELLELWQWREDEFETRLLGSPIRRIGYQSWLRNIAVALGNGVYSAEIIAALREKKSAANSMVTEHIDWAIAQLEHQRANQSGAENPAKDKTLKLIRCVTKMLPRDA